MFKAVSNTFFCARSFRSGELLDSTSCISLELFPIEIRTELFISAT